MDEGRRLRNSKFLSTPSARRATILMLILLWISCYFYPRPPRGGRLYVSSTWKRIARFLSTPSARRATWHGRQAGTVRRFLSTPSARRATVFVPVRYSSFLNFYPRPPRGGRRQGAVDIAQATPISIHALREEGDAQAVQEENQPKIFLSTPSARRATRHFYRLSRFLRHFYPRPPRGGRQLRSATLSSRSVFLSTPSARRATRRRARQCRCIYKFLSTPSARRATSSGSHYSSFRQYFYPRPPRGGRLRQHYRPQLQRRISIHALREEGDLEEFSEGNSSKVDFYPRPPRGGRRQHAAPRCPGAFISIHALREEGDFAMLGHME